MTSWLKALRATLCDWLGFLLFCLRHVAMIFLVAVLIWLFVYFASPDSFSWRPVAVTVGVSLLLMSSGLAILATLMPRSEMCGHERLGMLVFLVAPGLAFGTRLLWTDIPGPVWAYLVVWFLSTLAIYPAWDELGSRRYKE